MDVRRINSNMNFGTRYNIQAGKKLADTQFTMDFTTSLVSKLNQFGAKIVQVIPQDKGGGAIVETVARDARTQAAELEILKPLITELNSSDRPVKKVLNHIYVTLAEAQHGKYNRTLNLDFHKYNS